MSKKRRLTMEEKGGELSLLAKSDNSTPPHLPCLIKRKEVTAKITN
jgi:hypothetical protein